MSFVSSSSCQCFFQSAGYKRPKGTAVIFFEVSEVLGRETLGSSFRLVFIIGDFGNPGRQNACRWTLRVTRTLINFCPFLSSLWDMTRTQTLGAFVGVRLRWSDITGSVLGPLCSGGSLSTHLRINRNVNNKSHSREPIWPLHSTGGSGQ